MKAQEILGEITEREYVARRAEAGNMPRLNRVLEEMGVKYGDHPMPEKVLTSVHEKEAAAAEVAGVEAAGDAPKATGRKRLGGSSATGSGCGKRTHSAARTAEATEHAEETGNDVAFATPSGSAVASSAALGRGSGGGVAEAASKGTEVAHPSEVAPTGVEEAGVVASVAPLPSLFSADSADSVGSVRAVMGVDAQADVSSGRRSPPPDEPVGTVPPSSPPMPASPVVAAPTPAPVMAEVSAGVEMGATALCKACFLCFFVFD